MKKVTAIMLVFLLLLGVFAGCGKKDGAEKGTDNVSEPATVQTTAVTTTEPDPMVDVIDFSNEDGRLQFVRHEVADPALSFNNYDKTLLFVFGEIAQGTFDMPYEYKDGKLSVWTQEGGDLLIKQ